MLLWCERNNVGYIVGIAKNKRLNALTASAAISRCTRLLCRIGCQGALVYWYPLRSRQLGSQATGSSPRSNTRLKADNPRYVVTNLKGAGKTLYDKLYCARGEMENRIKEQQLDLFADRTSCHRWWPNQFRLLLSSLAYNACWKPSGVWP